MSKEIEGDTKWKASFLLSLMSKEIENTNFILPPSFPLSFMSKEIEKKILEIFEKLLDKQKKICYNIYDLSITKFMSLRRRGTVSLPSANSTACAIINFDR